MIKGNKIAGLLITVILILTGISGIQCTQASKDEVRIGYLLGDLHHLPFFVALDKGYFDDAAVNVKVVGPFDAGTAEMNALEADQLDMGYVGMPPAIIAAVRKVDLSIIAGVNTEGSALVVDQTISNVPDLRGKTIATPLPGSIQHIMFGMLLGNNNLSYSDVEVLPGTVKPSDMPAALETKNINGYIVWEPYVAKSVVNNFGRVLVESKDIWPDHPCCVLVTDNEFAKKHPAVVEGVVSAHKRAIQFIEGNPEEAKSIAVKYTKMDINVIEEALPRVKYTYMIDTEAPRRFVEEIISLGENGVIKPIILPDDVGDIDVFIDKTIDLNFLQE